MIDNRTEDELITPELERMRFTTYLTDASRKVATAAIRSFGFLGDLVTFIGEAWELYARSATGHGVLQEMAVIEVAEGDGIRTLHLLNFVAKVRMDGAPLQAVRAIKNSAPLWMTAHPDARFDGCVKIAPETLHGPLLDVSGNPGAVLARISSDMLEWHGGILMWPLEIDGKRWGVPLARIGSD